MDPRVVHGIHFHDFRCSVIAGEVVDNQQFPIGKCLLDHGIDRFADISSGIKCRQYNGYPWLYNNIVKLSIPELFIIQTTAFPDPVPTLKQHFSQCCFFVFVCLTVCIKYFLNQVKSLFKENLPILFGIIFRSVPPAGEKHTVIILRMNTDPVQRTHAELPDFVAKLFSLGNADIPEPPAMVHQRLRNIYHNGTLMHGTRPKFEVLTKSVGIVTPAVRVKLRFAEHDAAVADFTAENHGSLEFIRFKSNLLNVFSAGSN